MPASRILIVDDDKSIRDILRLTLEYEDYAVDEAESGLAALDRIAATEYGAAILDIKMSGIDGMETLERILDLKRSLPVIMLTGHGTIETAVQATKLGAFDFLTKPPDRDKLLVTLRNAVQHSSLQEQNRHLREMVDAGGTLVGSSPPMRALERLIERVAPTEAYVLITGENGSGKELVAQAVHQKSRRAGRPMVEVNCAAIPPDLIESELFGHEKGAFTGATALRIGKFEQADGGTIFLDEIGDMSLAAQAKVLRVVEEGTLERVGGGRLLHVDARIIAATNKDLEREIEKGCFREDLFHRLNVIRIEVPPLKDRVSDIPSLVAHFLHELAVKNRLPERSITPSAVAMLQERTWKGNVRELRNAVERLLIMSGSVIGEADVRELVHAPHRADGITPVDDMSFQDYKDRAEAEFLRRHLERNGWNVTKTAEMLDMQRSHLYAKIKKHGLMRIDSEE